MSSLKVTPYPYQADGISFGLKHRRILIGDEPGLGKTLQAIGIVNDADDALPALIICPSSLKINWQREFERFTGRRALILSNQVRSTWPYLLRMHMFDAAIVNYESLRKYFVWDAPRRDIRLSQVTFCPYINIFRSVIIDESHRVKDPLAQQSIYAKGIASGKQWIILLSGTPVVNRPADLLSQLSILDRLKEFGGRRAFLDRYGGGEKKQFSPRHQNDEQDRPRNLDELSRRLYASCLIRREKANVLRQLPAKTRAQIPVDISNRDEYDLAAQDLAQYLRQYKLTPEPDIRRKMRLEALVKFMTLRSLAAIGKVPQAIDFIRVFLANEKPLIVFCSLHQIVDLICQAFPQAVRVTGRDAPAQKQAAVDAFQSGKAKLIVCSIKAAGVGLTLTAASDVAFVEFPWTYADCLQCEDRAHRIGQRDNVTCYYLMGRRTIDPVLFAIINDKRSIAAQIMAADDDIPTDTLYFDQLTDSFLNDTALPDRP